MIKQSLKHLREELVTAMGSMNPNANEWVGFKLEVIEREYGSAARDEAIMDLGLDRRGFVVRKVAHRW